MSAIPNDSYSLSSPQAEVPGTANDTEVLIYRHHSITHDLGLNSAFSCIVAAVPHLTTGTHFFSN